MDEVTPEMLAVARQCAAKYWQTGDPGDEYAARMILSGEWDGEAYVQAALAALLERLSPEAVRDDGWQPIETAPRDQVILAWPGPGDDPVVVFWFKPTKGPGLWYEAGTDAYSVDPTHWRPLPPPPRQALSGQGEA